MPKLKAVLWDMDGVIVNTGEYHFKAWKDTLQQYDIPFSRETFRTTFGMNNKGILNLLLGDRYTKELYNSISNQKEEKFREIIQGNIKLLPGVMPLLEDIQTAQIPQAIASSAPKENIQTIVTELKLQSFFQTITSAYDMPGKPDPTVFISTAKELDVSPENCIVIEDAVTGVEASHRAGMKCIAVTTTNTINDLKNADLVVNKLSGLSLEDLYNLVRSTHM